MHVQSDETYTKYKKFHAYNEARKLKEEGKIKHFGISFHDKADVLDMILTENSDIEVVQIQFNYVDYEDPAMQSKACYEVCRKHNKPVIVMDPVKGSNLVNLPKEAKVIYDKLGTMSYASYTLRFAAGFDGMMMVLSGMSDIEQMKDNLSFMKDFQPLSLKEQEAVKQVTEIFKSKIFIPCTACYYCMEKRKKTLLFLIYLPV